MTYRQAVKNQRWLDSEPKTVSFNGVIVWFKNTIKSRVPVGYEDEKGFHFGVKPVERESN